MFNVLQYIYHHIWGKNQGKNFKYGYFSQMNNTFEERLRWVREKAGLSRKAFADVIGISDSNYARYEYGQVSPPHHFFIKLREKFNINIDWLLTGDGAPYTKGYKGFEIIPKRAQEAARRIELAKIADATADYSQEDELAMLREENERLRRALVALAQGKGESAQLPLAALAETIEMLQKSLDILQGIFGQAFPAEEDVK
ncbi:MAG TPA: XRE family transcriptional regulator [Gammaproteobacteria bacterium]|nr:XRE family transcriptional regulator [Gammaproteobacteria bacterium]